MSFRISNGQTKHQVHAETFTRTVHHISVDLAAVLSGFDPTDEVVLVIETPSGRPKRVTMSGQFLVSPNPVLEDF